MQFWTLQAAGWSGLCVLTFLSLTLWYNTVNAVYVQHTIVQAALGLLISLALRAIFRALWTARPTRRLVLSAAGVVVASFVWTAARIETFTAMTGEEGVWGDFGGWFFASLLVMLSWALAYHGIRFYQLMLQEREDAASARGAAAQERVRRLTAERDAQDAHLRMLRYQLNPHFLFNTLNSVTALAQTGRGAAATEMIGELSGFLRSTLREDVPLRTTLGNEIETLGLYLAIERKRFGERVDAAIDVPADAASASIPSLLLQPLVENSIKYAVAKTSTKTTITIKARRRARHLVVRVSDTGAPGRDAQEEGRDRGVGLSNIRERLEAEFDEDYRFRSRRVSQGGWTTLIRVPFQDSP